ncbi:MAG TPA: 6-pyruvoyl-tetrahydropterin synthase-related protein [Candidatus Andersenbacteria bacterium]|nr:6-pyruvoyl-tetrahydropterin synthase-related protein [Candidatus Andersenbacteria bacterium]
MLRSGRLSIVVTALLTAGLIAYSLTLPWDRVERNVVGLQGAPGRALTLHTGDEVTQSFKTVQPLLGYISIYTLNEKLTDQKLTLIITNEHGQKLAQAKLPRPAYRRGYLKLTFAIPWITTNQGESFTLHLRLEAGSPLELYTLTENVYRAGDFTFNQTPQPDLDLALVTARPAFLSPGAKKGVIAGLLTLAGAMFITLLPTRRMAWRLAAASLLLIIITPLALGGFWQNQDMLGINDWDFYFSVHEVLRRSLNVFHVFPFWNPYTCGGTAGLGDPEFPLFTPTFALELLFGVPLGLRLSIFLATAIGALGMLALGRRVGLAVEAALLAALVVAFGSVNLLEIVEGHPNIFAAMWIPWIFWAWLGAYQGRKRGSLICGIFLALTFYQSGVYLLFYTAAAFVGLILLAHRRGAALQITFRAGLWALGLAALKLIPALIWLTQFKDQSYASSIATLPYWYEILLGRHLHGEDILPNQTTGWHEYGAYIGPLALALAFLGLTSLRRSYRTRVLLLCAVLALLLSSAGPLLQPVFDQLPFLPRSTISRLILFAVVPLALLAGQGIDQIQRWLAGSRHLSAPLIGLTAVTLMSVSYPLSEQAFVVSPATEPISPAPPPIAFTRDTHPVRFQDVDYDRSYLATLAGFGTLNYCTPLSPPPSVATVGQSEDSSSVSVTDASHGTVQLHSWSYNRVVVQAHLTQPTQVVLNTNYTPWGWKVNGRPVREVANRVGISLPAGEHHLVFQYRSPGFIAGLIITAATAIFAIFLAIRQRR